MIRSMISLIFSVKQPTAQPQQMLHKQLQMPQLHRPQTSQQMQ
jgi:hypothetical protein